MDIQMLIAFKYAGRAKIIGNDLTNLENLEWIDTTTERPTDEQFEADWAEIEPIIQQQDILRQLAETDLKMPRVVEDNMDLLIEKELVSLDDYPEAVQELYNLKKELRGQL